MSTFAIVGCIDHLPRLLGDLSALRQVHRLRTGTGQFVLNGIWVERWAGTRPAADGSLRDRLSSGVLRVLTPLELSGIWALCSPEPRDVTRNALLDAIVDAAGGDACARTGRFLPVFHDHEALSDPHKEWESLSGQHPGIVLPPLHQSASGVIGAAHAGGVLERPWQQAATHNCGVDGRRRGAAGGPTVLAFRPQTGGAVHVRS